MSFYFKFDSFLSVDHEIVELWESGFKHFILSFAVQASSHKLYIQSSSHLGSTVLQTGTWYRMSFAYTITSTSVNEWRLYLNGTQEVSASNLSLSRIGSSGMKLGINDTNGPVSAILTRKYDVPYN